MEEMNFDEMRNQIAILKTKLDNQEIVNDKMMHEIISAKSNSIQRKMRLSILCGLFVIIVAPFCFHWNAGASWAFIIATDLLMIYCMIREFLFKRRIGDNALMNASLLDVAKKIKDFKKDYKRYTLSNIPLAVAWVIWLFAEDFIHNPETRHLTIPCMAVGAVLGLFIGLWIYFRMQNEASDIIKQIEE